MYSGLSSSVKASVEEALKSQTRTFSNRLLIGNSWAFSDSNATAIFTEFKTLTVQQNFCAAEELTAGGFPQQEFNAEIVNTANLTAFKGKIAKVECGVNYGSSVAYIPCGYFVINEAKTDNNYKTVILKGYDISGEWTGTFSGGSSSAKAWNVLSTFASGKGVTLAYNDSAIYSTLRSRTLSAEDMAALNAMSETEAIANIAGIVGANVWLNTAGKLMIGRIYDANYTVDRSCQWQGGYVSKADESTTISSVTSNDNDGDGGTYTAGSGSGIVYANSLITNTEITNVLSAINGTTIWPAECHWRGNPLIEAGDMLDIEIDANSNTRPFIIVSQTLDLCGGLSMDSQAPKLNEDIYLSSVDRKLAVVTTAYEDAIKEATAAINGVNGGYVEINDTNGDGNPDEILIKQYQDGSGNLIRMNTAGIGISSDGGETYNTAITGEGIYGGQITANSISAGQLNFSPITTENLETSVNGITIQGSTISSITAINGYTDLMETVDSKATTAEATAAGTSAGTSAAQAQIASFTVDHDLKYIGSDGIYTGTITAQQVNVGWQGGNYCSCKWAANSSDYLSKFTFEQDSNLYPQISVNSDISGEAKLYSAPFYAAKGAKIRITCAAYVVGSDASTQYIGGRVQYSSSATGTFTDKGDYFTTSSDSVNTKHSKSLEYEATAGGYYRFFLWFKNTNSGSYVNALMGTYTVTGNMVVTGQITSVDGETYFKLGDSSADESEIVTVAGIYKTRLSGGVVEMYANNSLKGLICAPYSKDGSGTKHYCLGLYYQDGNASSVSLGKRSSDGKDFLTAMDVFYNDGNSYAQIYSDFGGFETVNPNGYKGKFGIGTATYNSTTYISASLQVMSDDTKMARLDCIGFGDGTGAIRCQNGDDTSSWLTLGNGVLKYGGYTILNSNSTLSGSKISGAISSGSSITATKLVATDKTSMELGPTTYGAGEGGHLFVYSTSGTNWFGARFSPYHYDGTYGVELIEDNTTDATGIKLRPTTASWAHYLGSSSSRWKYSYFTNITSTNAVTVDSDRKIKEQIETLSDKYEAAFDMLRPVSYKHVSGDRIHTGFIAQEVEEAFLSQGLSANDFAGICKNKKVGSDDNMNDFNFNGIDDADISYALRYDEFIALCVDKIQKMDKRIKTLEGALTQ